MFGFSLPKLLFTVAVIAAVWYGFKYLGRLAERQADKRDAPPKRPASRRPTPPAADPGAEAQDMEACPVCGAYVVAGGNRNCGRDDCPYR